MQKIKDRDPRQQIFCTTLLAYRGQSRQKIQVISLMRKRIVSLIEEQKAERMYISAGSRRQTLTLKSNTHLRWVPAKHADGTGEVFNTKDKRQ